MDIIKNLISLTYINSLDNEKNLSEAFRLLNGLISKRNINECFEQATEMCVILAESCLKNNIKPISYDCIKLYFSLDPPENQFLARAYLVQAQLIRPERFDDESTLDKPIGFIIKAVNFSKKEKRFHYLVYNSSLVYYEVVRNYLRRSYFQYLCKSLSQIVKTLEEVNDSNMAWRSQLMLLLIQCHIDAGHKKEVVQIVDSTATFIGKHAPHLLKDLLTCLITNGIGTMEKYLWYTKSHLAMQMFIRLCKLKIMKDKDKDGSIAIEAKKILSILIGSDDSSLDGSAENLNPKSDLKAGPTVVFNSKKLTNEQRCSLLLDLAKISLQKSVFDVCHQSIDKIQQLSTEEMIFILQEKEFVNSELTMMEWDTIHDKITPTSLKLRLTTIEKCHSTLQNVIRSENNKLIELGCATLWNLCLPILQQNLRSKINHNLVLIADSLESISCLNYRLCTQVNIEVGKGYALLEQTNDAINYFKRARLLDRPGEYSELIDHFIHKLQMQEKLYEKLTNSCDLARQLLEQVKSTVSNEKIQLEKLRPLLAEIGHCLAPDDFLVLLDHDLSLEEVGIDKGIGGKATKTAAWENIITRLNSYLTRSGNDDDRIKVTLWVDLVKLSRKLQLWDVCRVASCFAILYDDGRWKNHFQVKIESSSGKGNRNTGANSNLTTPENSSLTTESIVSESDTTNSNNSEIKTKKKEESDNLNSAIKHSRYEKMLLEQLVETYFIRAEAFIQAIRNEGAQLFTIPERPKDFKKHPKGFVKDTTKEDEDWANYCACLQRLSLSVVSCFHRAAAISVDLQAPWVTQNAATYLWNYLMHIICLSDHGVLISSFQVMYDYIRQMINEKMIEIITQYGVVLAHGIIQKSMPTPMFTLDNIFEVETTTNVTDKKVKKDRDSAKGKSAALSAAGQAAGPNHAESVVQYKKALDICQYLMDITCDPSLPLPEIPSQTTNQVNNKVILITKLVDLRTKSRLIDIWVQCKQLLQQPINRMLGADDPESKIGQRANVRAITAVQMVWISQNEFYKFPDTSTIDECIQMIDSCEWSEPTVLLGLLLKLCHVTMRTMSSNVVNTLIKITEKAEKFCSFDSSTSTVSSGKTDNKNLKFSEERLAFSYIIFCHGISLHKSSSQSNAVLMQCLKLFVKASCFARDANNYFLVSQIAHYFWKVAQSLIERFSSTNQISTETEIILNCISRTVNRRRLKLFFEPHTEEEQPKIEAELEEKLPHMLQFPGDQKCISIDQCKSLFLTVYRKQMSKTNLEQDLKLRIQMYIAVFRSYFYQEKWSQALKILDDAIADLPRTHHRLELFRHRLLTKVRLGQNIELDIQKFKNQKEDEIALLWREVALRSKTTETQLFAYKKSIESLMLKDSDWLKADLIMEMSQWMFHCNFPLEVCCQYVNYAIDILLNIEIANEKKSPPNSSVKNKSRINSRKAESGVKDTTMKVIVAAPSDKSDLGTFTETSFSDDKKISAIGARFQQDFPATVNKITDIRLLSSLIVCFTFQAKLMSSLLGKYENCAIMANACVIRMWQVSMANVAGAIKDISKSKVDIESSGKPKEIKKDKKEKSAKPDPEAVKSKVPKRKGPVDWLPTNYEEWSVFEITDDVLEALKSPIYMPTTGFHETSINNMGQFMSSCDALIDILEELGYELLSFPVLSLLDALSRSDDAAPAKLSNQYVHLRSMQISIGLNMHSSISHHEKFIDMPFVSPEYSAYVEIIKVRIDEYKSQNKSLVLPMNFKAQSILSLEVPHLLRKHTKSFFIHESWIKVGTKLIDLGYNKEAADVIYAAEALTDVLHDNEMTSNIKILKAKLLKNQGELQEALQYLDELENSCSQFTFDQWERVIDLMIDIGSHYANQYKDICAMRTRLLRLKDHTQRRVGGLRISNQKAITDNLVARMDSGILLLDTRMLVVDHGDDLCWEKDSDTLQNFLCRLDEIDSFYQQNHNTNGTCETMLKKIEIFNLLIKMTSGDENKSKSLILSKLRVSERLLDLQMTKSDNVRLICSQTQDSSLSFRSDRRLARFKIILVDCLMEIYSRNVARTVQSYLEHQQKDPLKQIVDEYVADVIPDTDSPEWLFVSAQAADRITSHLNDIHTLCPMIPDINAQCLMKYGHLMKLRAMEVYPNSGYQWSNNKIESHESKPIPPTEQSNTDVLATDSETENQIPDQIITVREHAKSIKYAKLKKAMSESREYLAQATEMFHQSINISINNQFYDICSMSIELLMDILGHSDIQLTIQLLCLYQNCRASIKLRNILLTTLRHASIGQLAALVLQHNYMSSQTKLNELNLTQSPLYRLVLERLNSNFVAWKMTNVSLSQTDLLKDLSSIASGACIFQHSIDNDFLYFAFIDGKVKISNTTKGATRPTPDRSRICRMKISPESTKLLNRKWHEFKVDLENLVYKIENKKQVLEQQTVLYSQIENENEMGKALEKKEQMQEHMASEISNMEYRYADLIESTEEYLSPILSTFVNLFSTETDRVGSTTQRSVKESVQTIKDSMVLLIDDILGITSLEMISQFKSTISRDFSLQIMCHRVKGLSATEPVDPSQNPDATKKKEKSKIPHRIPVFRDANKKSAKVLPLNRQIPIGTISVDTHQVRYIVDPFSDTNVIGTSSLGSVFKKELTGPTSLREQQITPRWTGLVGQDDHPSIGEMELYIKDATSLLYVNTESLVSLLTPQRVAMLNTTELQLLCCFDRMKNRRTKERITPKSSTMNSLDLQSLNSVTAAQLITLMGVRSLVCNQWSGLVDWSSTQISNFISNFMDEGANLGDCIRLLRSQMKVIEEVVAADKNLANFFRSNLVLYGLPNLMINGSS